MCSLCLNFADNTETDREFLSCNENKVNVLIQNIRDN